MGLHFLKFGVPFLAVVVGGSFGLKHFTSVRYQFRRSHFVKEDFEAEGIAIKQAPTLEEAYKEHIAELTEDWEPVRGPRPWEDNSAFEAVKRQRKEEKLSKTVSTPADLATA